jgi:hypothetical protein
MRHAFTAVLERNSVFTVDFATEPYEVVWAGEARWFVRILTLTGDGATLTITPQRSPDVLVWCDADRAPLELCESGMVTRAMRDFGHWLRLDCTLHGDHPEVKVLIYLALKE